jgi:Rer1 family
LIVEKEGHVTTGFCYYLMLTLSFSSVMTVNRAIQYWLDKSTIHIVPRWIAFVVLLLLFFLRVYLVQGYFIVAYGLGIFLLNNFIAFLSPLDDPSSLSMNSGSANDDGPSLPTSAKEGKEFRPFTRRLPEFKFWLSSTRGVGTSIMMTFFSVFDIPVFWPILLIYFFILFFMTMKRQIIHMYQHKYVPISWGKVKSKNAGIERGMFGGGMRRDR